MIGRDAYEFGRMLTAMVTPFDQHTKIDFGAVEKLVEHLIATGTTTIVVAGTTGESPTLEEVELKELLSFVVKQVRGRVKVVMGTGANNTAKTVKSTKEAEALGADGALVVVPYYNKPSQAGMVAHFSEVAVHTKLPIIVYNIPGRTGVNMLPETMIELAAKHKNIHALKDSTGNVDQSGEIASGARADFRIYSGDDNLTLPFLSVGACGIISVASHIIGRDIEAMINAFFAGDTEKARSEHYRLLPLFKGLFAAPNPTCVKYALSKLGICKETLRLPLIPLSDAQKTAMDKLLSGYELASPSYSKAR